MSVKGPDTETAVARNWVSVKGPETGTDVARSWVSVKGPSTVIEPPPSSIDRVPPASLTGTGEPLVLLTVTLVGTVMLEMVTEPPSKVTGIDAPAGPETCTGPSLGPVT